MCFSEIELIQKWWLSLEDRQMLESKDVSKDNPKKPLLLAIQWGGGGGYFVALRHKVTNLVGFLFTLLLIGLKLAFWGSFDTPVD